MFDNPSELFKTNTIYQLTKRIHKIMKKAINRTTHLFLAALSAHFYLQNRKIKKVEKSDLDNRYMLYFSLTTQWIKNKQENIELAQYFHDKSIKTIAIYGLGSMEELLYNELKDSDIEIKYMTDQNARAYQFAIKEFPVIFPSEIPNQEPVDAIIVTPIFAYQAICNDLEKYNCSAEIISLEDIIFELSNYKRGKNKHE